ncbi:hypothetical protein BDR07DRAFT_1498585 [Suillus spraguei]|nr:hypothetical protein BDR07DRAFT_1498585 [Suillus spraguei]
MDSLGSFAKHATTPSTFKWRLSDVMASVDAGDNLAVQDGDEWYEHDGCTGDTRLVQPAVTTSTGVDDEEEDHACEAKETVGKLKAIFRCQQTNNKQLILVPPSY